MKRRSRPGEPVKARRRKTAARKRRIAPKTVRPQSYSASDPEQIIARLTHERDEALEQQRAAAEVLNIISASRTELQPVLEVVVKGAARYCKADDVTLFELDGQDLLEAAHWGAVPHFEGLRFPCTRGSVAGRIIVERKPVHVIDLQAEAEDFPEGSAVARRFGHRTIAGVPLLREGVAVGTLQIRRTEVNPFTDKQIALLETFAAQAVIAIENARLLNELRESLDRQTATSEVLSVISSSPGELEPVFQTMLENATPLCEAKFGVLYRFDGNAFHFAAEVGSPKEYVEFNRQRGAFQPMPGAPLERVMLTKAVCHITDDTVSNVPGIAARLGGARTQVIVPMLKDSDLVGAIIICRQEVRPSSEKQIALVQNFAAQAVIAIENTRLLNELRRRTADLSEALEQQTATSEVLSVIISSPGELEPVFQAILENATRICEAKFGVLSLSEGDPFRVVAMHNAPSAYAELRQREPILRPSGNLALTRAVATKRAVQIADATDDPANRGDPIRLSFIAATGARSFIVVPMLKDNKVIGVINVYRQEAGAFTDKQIALLMNFAAHQ